MSSTVWRWWGPVVLYMALIFFVSSRARPSSLDEAPDVLLHGGAYFVMAVLAVRALARGVLEPASTGALVGGVAIAVVYGASDELHQSFVPARVGSWQDLLYDAVGAFVAAAALMTFWHFRGALR